MKEKMYFLSNLESTQNKFLRFQHGKSPRRKIESRPELLLLCEIEQIDRAICYCWSEMYINSQGCGLHSLCDTSGQDFK